LYGFARNELKSAPLAARHKRARLPDIGASPAVLAETEVVDALRASTAQADALECTAIGILNIIIDTSIYQDSTDRDPDTAFPRLYDASADTKIGSTYGLIRNFKYFLSLLPARVVLFSQTEAGIGQCPAPHPMGGAVSLQSKTSAMTQ